MNVTLNIQNQYWTEKARLRKFPKGGINTSYFDMISKIMSIDNKVELIRENDIVNTNHNHI